MNAYSLSRDPQIQHLATRKMAQQLGLRTPEQLNIDITSTSMSTTWQDWVETLEMYFVAAGLRDTKRKKALLLYTGGQELTRLHRTLNDDQETYEDTKALLDAYFTPTRDFSYDDTIFLPVRSSRKYNIYFAAVA